MRVIGVTGVKGSGKNTTFELLNRHYPDIKEVALAGKLKEVCQEVFGLTQEQITDRILKEAALDEPVYLDADSLKAVYAGFGEAENVEYDKHIRPHVGMCLESPRRVLQYVGTEVLRSIRDNIHSFYLYSQIKDQDGVFFITDLRFPDEHAFFAENMKDEFEAWYINNKRAEAAGSGDLHPSERGIFEIKPKAIEVDNNGTLEDFEKVLLDLYKKA